MNTVVAALHGAHADLATTYLAAPAATADWTQTEIGKWIVKGMAIVGGIVVVIAVFKAIGSFISGKPGNGVKMLVGGAIIAAFMFKPTLINTIIELFADIIDKIFGSVKEVDKGPGSQ